MRENLRLQGKILSAKIFKQGGKWFVSVAAELQDIINHNPKQTNKVGIDLGITDLATLSNGEKNPSPKTIKKTNSNN